MNPIFFVVVIGAVLGVVGFFFLPIQSFFFSFIGVVISIMGIMIHKIIKERTYPCEIRIWERRFGKPTIVEVTRAKRITKEGFEMYSCLNRTKFKAPERENIIASPKGHFIDMFKLSNNQYQPMKHDFQLKTIKIVPDDDVRTLADLTIKTVEATKPIEDRLMKFMPIMLIAVTGIILVIMMITFMQYFPEFVKEVTSVMSAQIDALRQTTSEFSSAVSNYTAVVRGSGDIPPPPY